MKTVTLYEYGLLRPLLPGEPEPVDQSPWRRWVPERWYHQLRSFDQRRGESDQVFRWEHNRARARQWVGVVQHGALCLELLPKVEEDKPDGAGGDEAQIRRNLLWFLSVGGMVPYRERDLALLQTSKSPLLEVLAWLFAQGLLDALLRGPHRTYLTREDNLQRFKGKLVVAAQVARNAAHRTRFVCRFDELSENTVLNQVLRCAASLLATRTRRPATQEALHRSITLLEAVTPVDVMTARRLAARLVLDRLSARFADLLTFARLVLDNASPDTRAGDTSTFSLLFDMNRVFESFVAGFLRRHVLPSVPGWHLAAQAVQNRRWLLQGMRGPKAGNPSPHLLQLKPDLLLTQADGTYLVLDTKWKALHPRGSAARKRPVDTDFYQLHAYGTRYGSPRSILLYPCAPKHGPVMERYEALDADNQAVRQIELRTLNLHEDFSLRDRRESLAQALREMLVLPP